MSSLTEEAFRALLDPNGVLRPGALRAPERASSYAVFAQRSDARLDVEALERQAARFFATRLGVTVDKRYGGHAPEVDAARVVIAADDGTATGTRLCYGRRAEAGDVIAAEEAERLSRSTGLALLAQRCGMLWLIAPERHEGKTSPIDDRVALTMAAIFASSMLGPILPPGGGDIFGVRTARLKLEGNASPYR